jgi:hypothetical protein
MIIPNSTWLRIFVTGNPPARGGGGMPQRIMTISRSAPALRTTGAGFGKHTRHCRQVADIAVHHPEERDDGRLVGRDRIDCTS